MSNLPQSHTISPTKEIIDGWVERMYKLFGGLTFAKPEQMAGPIQAQFHAYGFDTIHNECHKYFYQAGCEELKAHMLQEAARFVHPNNDIKQQAHDLRLKRLVSVTIIAWGDKLGRKTLDYFASEALKYYFPLD